MNQYLILMPPSIRDDTRYLSEVQGEFLLFRRNRFFTTKTGESIHQLILNLIFHILDLPGK